MLKKSHTIYDLLFLSLLSIVVYTLFLHSYALLIPDEGRYAGIAQEMLTRGNWITPRQNGMLFMDKPILFYWLEMLSMKLWGINEFAVRFVPALFGVLGMLLTYIAGIVLYNRRVALIAALILMTTPIYFFLSHYVNMDLAMAVLISGSLWFFIMGVSLDRASLRRKDCLLLAYLFAGLAVLTKGLLGLVFPVLIVGSWVLILHEWRQLKNLYLIRGAIIILLVTVPWYLVMQLKNPHFFNYFFIVQHVERFISHGFNMQNPFYYYFLIVIGGFFPWTFFLPQSFHYIVKRLRFWRKGSVEWFIFLWIVLIFIFFSIPVSKIPSYILPIFPPIAMLMARYFDQSWNRLFERRSFRLSLWCLTGFIMGIIILLFLFPTHPGKILLTPATKLLAMIAQISLLVLLVVGWVVKRFAKSFKPFFIFLISAIVIFMLIGYANIDKFFPSTGKRVALKMREYLKPNGMPATFIRFDQSTAFYLRQPIYIVGSNWHSPHLLTRDNWRSELVKGSMLSGNWQYLLDFRQFKIVWQSTQQVVVLVPTWLLETFKDKISDQYTILDQVDNIYIVTQK